MIATWKVSSVGLHTVRLTVNGVSLTAVSYTHL